MSIVTKTGDKGETGLYGGRRLPKDNVRIEAYGTVDELNAVIGLVLAEKDVPEKLQTELTALQHTLFRLGADLATPLDSKAKVVRVAKEHIDTLEQSIQEMEKILPVQTKFILPGGSRIGALLHLARTVCRRAERRLVSLMHAEEVNHDALIFLNRLSDYLFLLARKTHSDAGIKDVEVEY